MPIPTLLEREGKPVEEWSPSLRELEERPRVRVPGVRKTFKPLPLPRIPQRELLLIPERIPPRVYLDPRPFWCRIICPPRYRVRKNQRTLTSVEWARFIDAVQTLAEAGTPSPRYGEFVEIHRLAMDTHPGMAWGAHSMGPPPMDGRNFLTWHREYLAKLEASLIMINPLVTIPYWDWVNDRAIPPQLANPSDLAAWGITRNAVFNPAWLPTGAQVNAAMAATDFVSFSSAIEGPHGWVHGAVGGTMGGSTSPADPLFWLHHGFIDKLWADWQAANPGAAFNPPNVGETLLPAPIMTRRVSQVLSTRTLGYVYA
jgi:tyrosinase